MCDNYLISIVPAISLLVVVIGWFVNNWLNRKHEVAKKRTDLRIEVLKSFILISKKLNFRQNEFSADQMLDVQIDFLVIGYTDEIDLINKLVINLKENNLELTRQQLSSLTNLVRKRLRKELGLPEIS